MSLIAAAPSKPQHTLARVNSPEFTVLPAPRSLGVLRDARPAIVVDTREQSPLAFSRLESVPGTLQTGDYSLHGCESAFAIERKSLNDLVQSVTTERERFERELHRLRGFRFRRLLLVCSREDVEQHRYHSKANAKAVLGSLNAYEVRFDVPLVWIPDVHEAARQVETWVWYYAREIALAATQIARVGPATPSLDQEAAISA